MAQKPFAREDACGPSKSVYISGQPIYNTAHVKKLPLKYGLLIAAGAIAWTIIAHAVVTDPTSSVHGIGAPIVFNVLQFAGIYLGISASARDLGDRPTFKQGLKTGVWISFVYAATLSLFFLGAILIIGTKWMAGEPGAQRMSITLLAIQAFAGLFLGSMLFGLVYSTLISFVLAKRQTRQV